MSDQVILITGATDGLGRGLANDLAETGATLLLHGRDDARGRETIAEIRAPTGNEKLHWYRADLAALDEVRDLAPANRARARPAERPRQQRGDRDHAARNGGRMESRDGYELRFAVNYLAGFLLTRLLQALIVRSAPARIVNVSSAGQAPIDFDEVMLERSCSGIQAYCQSKLAQVMFTFDLAEDLRDAGVTANCLHPGTYLPTKMVHAAGVAPATPLEQGVRAVRRLALHPELDGVTGRYFDGALEARAHEQAYDAGARRRLRELSERLAER